MLTTKQNNMKVNLSEPKPCDSCDTMVVFGDSTVSGNTMFAKNSDRPAHEAQPLELNARAQHSPGMDAGCQFVRVPQIDTTWRHGYEHGLNEHQVSIGNEYLPAIMEASPELRLIGMELVRLGLERGATAREAVYVITSHVEEFGQGSFSNDADVYTYNNSYIVADPLEAFVIEAVGHDWAVKELIDTTSISNIGSIRDDWTSTSKTEAGEHFDWAVAFTQETENPNAVRRQYRTDDLLCSHRSNIDAQTMMSIMSDHSLDDDISSDFNPFPGDIRGVCVHAIGDNVQNTTASLIADFCADGSRLPVYWRTLYSPCMGLYYPVFLEGELPSHLAIGDAEKTDDSPWWMFHELTKSGLVEGHDRIAQIRDGWIPLQKELLETAYELARQGAELIRNGRESDANRMLTKYMAGSVSRMLVTTRELLEMRAASGS